MPEVEIRQQPAMRLVGLEHRGSYMEIGKAFDELHTLFSSRKLYGPGQKLAAIYFDDMSRVKPKDLRSFAGVVVDDALPAEPPLTELKIEAGTHAVLRHVGPYADLGASYEWLFGTWLPKSGREESGRPSFEIYLNSPMDTQPKDLITEIYLPLK